jgi:hypothetical protein
MNDAPMDPDASFMPHLTLSPDNSMAVNERSDEDNNAIAEVAAALDSHVTENALETMEIGTATVEVETSSTQEDDVLPHDRAAGENEDVVAITTTAADPCATAPELAIGDTNAGESEEEHDYDSAANETRRHHNSLELRHDSSISDQLDTEPILANRPVSCTVGGFGVENEQLSEIEAQISTDQQQQQQHHHHLQNDIIDSPYRYRAGTNNPDISQIFLKNSGVMFSPSLQDCNFVRFKLFLSIK